MGCEHFCRHSRNGPDALVVLDLFTDDSNGSIHVGGRGHGHQWRHYTNNTERTASRGHVGGSAGLRGVARRENHGKRVLL